MLLKLRERYKLWEIWEGKSDKGCVVIMQIGRLVSIRSGDDLRALEVSAQPNGFIVLDMQGWRIIPAENLVAAFQVFQPSGRCKHSNDDTQHG